MADNEHDAIVAGANRYLENLRRTSPDLFDADGKLKRIELDGCDVRNGDFPETAFFTRSGDAFDDEFDPGTFPKRIDPAIMRPGRLTEVILIEPHTSRFDHHLYERFGREHDLICIIPDEADHVIRTPGEDLLRPGALTEMLERITATFGDDLGAQISYPDPGAVPDEGGHFITVHPLDGTREFCLNNKSNEGDNDE